MRGIEAPAGHAQVGGSTSSATPRASGWCSRTTCEPVGSRTWRRPGSRARFIPGDWERREPLGEFAGLLLTALRAAAPEGAEDPIVAALSDGPANSAVEHRLLAQRMGVPIVTPQELTLRDGLVHCAMPEGTRRLDAIYRRTDQGA